MTIRIGIDIGGTFTDLAITDASGEVAVFKSPTTHGDYTKGILTTLEMAAKKRTTTISNILGDATTTLVHGSTIATNAVLENKAAKVGMIFTEGHKHILWRRDGGKRDVFDFSEVYPEPLVPTPLCLGVKERVDSGGYIKVALDEHDAIRSIQALVSANVEAIGVCLLWATANSAHEKRIGELIADLAPGLPFCLSSEVQPTIGEYQRASATALNAMLRPVVGDYIRELAQTLQNLGYRHNIFVVTSSGAMVTVDEACRLPVYLLLSGPSMAPRAAAMNSAAIRTPALVATDMGGTSFDVSVVVEGQPQMTRDAQVGGYPTGIASVEVLSLGAGGGSIAWVDDGGLLHVGPESAGSDPGPACYNRGGLRPTVTDANLVLGVLSSDRCLGGTLSLDLHLAEQAIKTHVADPLGISITEAAAGIRNLITETMLGGMVAMTTRRGLDPRKMTMVAGGGAGGAHAATMACKLSIATLVVPRHGAALCAIGMLHADLAFTITRSAVLRPSAKCVPYVASLIDGLTREVCNRLSDAGVATTAQIVDCFVAMRFQGQVTELEVPFDFSVSTELAVSKLEASFRSTYCNRYETDPGNTARVECAHWRVIGRAKRLFETEKPLVGHLRAKSQSSPEVGKRSIWFAETAGFVEATVHRTELIGVGDVISGPAVIEDENTTLLIPPEATARADASDAFVLTINRSSDR